MIAPRHENARLQSIFYRDQFRRIVGWLLVTLVIIFALITTIAYLLVFHPTPRYYANTSEGVILAMPTVK